MQSDQQKPCVVFDRVSLGYEKKNPLLDNVSLELEAGKFFFLKGVSGSGKTSLFKALLLVLEPFQGTIKLFDKKTRGLPFKARVELRQKIGVVFQDYKLLNHLSVKENVALPLCVRGLPQQKANTQAEEILDWMGVSSVRNAHPSNLSGGEKQRVAIARAIITHPQLLLADEPTGNIDDDAAYKITCLLERLHKAGTTVIMATHNQPLIESFPYEILHLQERTIKRHQTSPKQIAS